MFEHEDHEDIVEKLLLLFGIVILSLLGAEITLNNIGVYEEVIEKPTEDKIINTYQILKGKNENLIRGGGSGYTVGNESGNFLWHSGETSGNWQMNIDTNKQFTFYYRDENNVIHHKEIPFNFKIIEIDEEIARLDEHQRSHESCLIKKRKSYNAEEDQVIKTDCKTIIDSKYNILYIPRGLFDGSSVTLE